MSGKQRPVKPTRLIVKTVGVVVTVLSAPNLVPHQDHWQAQRKHRHREEILHLAISQRLHGRIVARTLNAEVITSVVIGAVVVRFAVCLIVLVGVGDEVIEREAVVAGDEIYACLGLAFLVSVYLGAAEHAVSQGRNDTVVAAKKAAHSVAKPPIPFSPAIPNKLPTWYKPAASQASAISLAPAKAGSERMRHFSVVAWKSRLA